MCLLDNKTGLNVSVFLKQFKGGSKDVIEWIQAFNIQTITVEQITALEKLLPDTHTVNSTTQSYYLYQNAGVSGGASQIIHWRCPSLG